MKRHMLPALIAVAMFGCLASLMSSIKSYRILDAQRATLKTVHLPLKAQEALKTMHERPADLEGPQHAAKALTLLIDGHNAEFELWDTAIEQQKERTYRSGAYICLSILALVALCVTVRRRAT